MFYSELSLTTANCLPPIGKQLEPPAEPENGSAALEMPAAGGNCGVSQSATERYPRLSIKRRRLAVDEMRPSIGSSYSQSKQRAENCWASSIAGRNVVGGKTVKLKVITNADETHMPKTPKPRSTTNVRMMRRKSLIELPDGILETAVMQPSTFRELLASDGDHDADVFKRNAAPQPALDVILLNGRTPLKLEIPSFGGRQSVGGVERPPKPNHFVLPYFLTHKRWQSDEVIGIKTLLPDVCAEHLMNGECGCGFDHIYPTEEEVAKLLAAMAGHKVAKLYNTFVRRCQRLRPYFKTFALALGQKKMRKTLSAMWATCERMHDDQDVRQEYEAVYRGLLKCGQTHADILVNICMNYPQLSIEFRNFVLSVFMRMDSCISETEFWLIMDHLRLTDDFEFTAPILNILLPIANGVRNVDLLRMFSIMHQTARSKGATLDTQGLIGFGSEVFRLAQKQYSDGGRAQLTPPPI